MRGTGALTLLALVATLGACASLSEKDCAGGDWRGIGRADGQHGLPAGELDKHRKACAAQNVVPDEAAYKAGRDEGLAEYCTPAWAYVNARRGLGYSGVCATRNEGAFLEAYRGGQQVATVMRDVYDLRRNVDELEVAAMTRDVPDAERTQMRMRAGDLNQRLRMREWDLEKLDRDFAKRFGAPELTWSELRSLNP